MLDRIAYGGDYNPEQWPEEVWAEDARLMREAGVNLVSVGIFSWALLEPAAGCFDLGWLDRVLGLLWDAGVAANLATPTAAPPAWLLRQHPELRPVTREGHVLGGGARNGFCPSSPVYAEAASRITETLATHFAGHPALAGWHVHNEYGGHLPACYCEVSEAAFREWLRERYGSLHALNEAWGTAFWGQRYGDWLEIEPPRTAPTVVNPAQELDYMRFSSDAYLACFKRERDILHRVTPGTPVSTNLMVTNCKNIDGWRWAREMDLVANDHYLRAEQPDNHVDLAMAADLTRSLAGGQPWLLMEHSTSAITWQPRNLAKRPGEMRRNSFAHVARGADAVMFFQWRAALSGAEKFHSAMLPHGGARGRIWKDVTRLGADLAALRELRGSRVVPDVAMLWDWESWWALELEWHPSCDLRYFDTVYAHYAALWRAHLTVDFAHPESSDLGRYPLVVVPNLYLVTPAAAANLAAYVAGGGTLFVGCFSGIVDGSDRIHPGGHPGALRELLGLEVEEFLPLRAGATVRLEQGLVGDVWAEHVTLAGAEAMLRYVDGPAAGGPAVARHRVGDGVAWYVSTRLSGEHLGQALRWAGVGVGVWDGLAPQLEVVRRVADGRDYVFAINHGSEEAVVPVAGIELLTGAVSEGQLRVPAGEVRIVREK